MMEFFSATECAQKGVGMVPQTARNLEHSLKSLFSKFSQDSHLPDNDVSQRLLPGGNVEDRYTHFDSNFTVDEYRHAKQKDHFHEDRRRTTEVDKAFVDWINTEPKFGVGSIHPTSFLATLDFFAEDLISKGGDITYSRDVVAQDLKLAFETDQFMDPVDIPASARIDVTYSPPPSAPTTPRGPPPSVIPSPQIASNGPHPNPPLSVPKSDVHPPIQPPPPPSPIPPPKVACTILPPKPECVVVHLTSPCRYGAKCTRKNCKFDHSGLPGGRASINPPAKSDLVGNALRDAIAKADAAMDCAKEMLNEQKEKETEAREPKEPKVDFDEEYQAEKSREYSPFMYVDSHGPKGVSAPWLLFGLFWIFTAIDLILINFEQRILFLIIESMFSRIFKLVPSVNYYFQFFELLITAFFVVKFVVVNIFYLISVVLSGYDIEVLLNSTTIGWYLISVKKAHKFLGICDQNMIRHFAPVKKCDVTKDVDLRNPNFKDKSKLFPSVRREWIVTSFYLHLPTTVSPWSNEFYVSVKDAKDKYHKSGMVFRADRSVIGLDCSSIDYNGSRPYRTVGNVLHGESTKTVPKYIWISKQETLRACDTVLDVILSPRNRCLYTDIKSIDVLIERDANTLKMVNIDRDGRSNFYNTIGDSVMIAKYFVRFLRQRSESTLDGLHSDFRLNPRN